MRLRVQSNLQDSLRRVLLVVLAWCVSLGTAHSQSVGFDRLEPSATGPQFSEVAVWYPSISAAHHRVGLHGQKVAYKGLPDGEHLPLVVVSFGGDTVLWSHTDTAWALASAGFVVAVTALRDDTPLGRTGMSEELDRFGAISQVIDHLAIHWRFDIVAADRVGVFGFASGAVPALVTVGARLDLAAVSARRLRDDRVRSAAIVAPALEGAMSLERLNDVIVPLQLWEAEFDRMTTAPHAQIIESSLLLSVDYRLVRGAGHFDFLAPCDENLASLAPGLCVEASGFRRSIFHSVFNHEIVRFFQRTLRDGGPWRADRQKYSGPKSCVVRHR